ncbi:hypothetical protein [Thalassolituus marinus]|uniref:Uncharacterized protein n=1 Tax=Thalassolituus marinus TaxID=671053 RepID=A0ABS7ZSG5_9GAMM|nr:hypothetical protein [Thalassolituus marinus]MCA6064188.1 hypothetical protein [Thalassolituus marinus]
MKIYRIEPMVDTYGMLELSSKAITDVYGDLGFDELREAESNLADTWPECGAALYDYHTAKVLNLHDLPDIYTWNGCFLVLSERAKKRLQSLLERIGEFLPFTLDSQRYHLFSLHSIVTPDSINSELLEEDGVSVGIKSLSFELPDIGSPVAFKTDFDYFNHVYCTEQFKQNVIESGLKSGIDFAEKLAYRRPV